MVGSKEKYIKIVMYVVVMREHKGLWHKLKKLFVCFCACGAEGACHTNPNLALVNVEHFPEKV